MVTPLAETRIERKRLKCIQADSQTDKEGKGRGKRTKQTVRQTKRGKEGESGPFMITERT